LIKSAIFLIFFAQPLPSMSLNAFPVSLPEPGNYYTGWDAPGRLRARNAIVFLRTDKKSLQQRNFGNRIHHRHVLLFVLQTNGRISVDGTPHPLNEGNAYIVLPYQFHHYMDLMENSLRWLFITFELEDGGDILSGLGHRVLVPTDTELTLTEQIVALWKRSSQHRSAAELLTLLDLLLLHFVRRHPPTYFKPLASHRNSWISRIESLLMQSIHEGTTLADVAVRAGLSERQLRKRFEQEMGVSIRRYKATYQLHQASALMRQTDLSLSQIGEMTGFNSQAVFTRFVQRETGQTPSAWRKAVSGQ
jgi:AraC-like DNA-binding protein